MRRLLQRVFLLLTLLGVGGVIAQETDITTIATRFNVPSDVAQTGGEVQIELVLRGNASACPRSVLRSSDVVIALPARVDPIFTESITQFLELMTFDRTPANQGDQVGIVVYDATTRALNSLSQNTRQLLDSLSGITDSPMRDVANAISGGTATLTDPTLQNTGATRVLIVVTEGNTADTAEIERVAQIARAGVVSLLIVNIGEDLPTLQAIANGGYYLRTVDQLPATFVSIANALQVQPAAANLSVTFAYNNSAFELIENSAEPAARVDGNRLTWSRNTLLDNEETSFFFRVRPRTLLGAQPLGQWVDSNYLPCADSRLTTSSLTSESPIVNISAPTPTPTPTATSTPRPPQPTGTPAPAGIEQTAPLMDTRPITQVALLPGITFCMDGIFALLPLIIALVLFVLLLLWAFRAYRKMQNNEITLGCFLSRLAFWAVLAFVLWLFLLPPITYACQSQDTILFWRQEGSSGFTGIYSVMPDRSDAVPVAEMNGEGCVGCHTTTTGTDLVGVVTGASNGRIALFQNGQTQVDLPPINGSFMSLSPDGQFLVVSNTNYDLVIVNLSTQEITPLAGASDPDIVETMPNWGYNGQIAFVRTENRGAVSFGGARIDSPTDIYTIPATGGTATPLSGASGSGFNYYPAYSPDGKWLAFTKHNNQTTYGDLQAEIWILPATGGTARRLSANDNADGTRIANASNSWTSWSRDSKQLAFNSRRNDARYDIFTTNIDEQGNSSEAIPVPAASVAGVFEHNPFWSEPIERIDLVQTWLSLLPWLIPPFLLFLLARWMCQKEKQVNTSAVTQITPQLKPVSMDVEVPKVLWEPKPALIIGLGNTGRWTLTHLKKNMVDATWGDTEELTSQMQLPKGVRLLAIDTGNYVKRSRDNSQAVVFGNVSLDNEREVIELRDNLAQFLLSDPQKTNASYRNWLKSAELRAMGSEATDLENGDGQQRLLARAGLLYHLQNSKGDSNLWERMKALAKECQENDRLTVVVVGDTTSGIGSAGLIDVAVMAKRLLDRGYVKGVTVYAHLVSARDSHIDNLNTAATLREIERYQLAEARPFNIQFGIPELDGKWETLPFDALNFYDGALFKNTLPQHGILPMIADIITVRLDKAIDAQDIKKTQDEENNARRKEQERTNRLQLASEGVYQYRLPFADITRAMSWRFSREVLLRLLTADKPKDDPTLADMRMIERMLPAELRQDANHETPDDVARAFLSDKISFGGTPPKALTIFDLAQAEKVRNADIRALMSKAKSEGNPKLGERLEKFLSWILNGGATTKDNVTARGAKINFALQFLEALKGRVITVQNTLKEISKDSETFIKHLEELKKPCQIYVEALTKQAELIGVTGRETETLLSIMKKSRMGNTSLREETQKIARRRYLWDDNGKLFEDVWYEQYLEKRVSEALGMLLWKVTSDNIALTLQAGDKGPVQLQSNTLKLFYARLYEVAQTLCQQQILPAETLEKLAQKPLIANDKLPTTTSDMLTRSQTPLEYDTVRAAQSKKYFMVLVNETFTAKDAMKKIIEQQKTLDTVLRVNSGDKYSLSVLSHQGIVPLHALNIQTAWNLYATEYGLTDNLNVKAPQKPRYTAVFEAESEAINVEKRLITELNLKLIDEEASENFKARHLHPLVLIGLTDLKRLRVFCLALASGEILVKEARDTTQPPIVRLSTDDNDIDFGIETLKEALNPYVSAMLRFTWDTEKFSPALVDSLLKRYRNDEDLIAIWRKWLDDGDGKGWSKTLSQFGSTPQAIYDLVHVARLWVQEFSREMDDE